jgi:hypothetical protein
MEILLIILSVIVLIILKPYYPQRIKTLLEGNKQSVSNSSNRPGNKSEMTVVAANDPELINEVRRLDKRIGGIVRWLLEERQAREGESQLSVQLQSTATKLEQLITRLESFPGLKETDLSNGNPHRTEEEEHYPQKLYGLYPDSDSLPGFVIRNMSKTAQNKCYEITIHSAQTASYTVTQDSETQLFAIINFDVFIKDACKCENRPTSTSQAIIAVKEGQLENQGDVWKIVEKLTIKFE